MPTNDDCFDKRESATTEELPEIGPRPSTRCFPREDRDTAVLKFEGEPEIEFDLMEEGKRTAFLASEFGLKSPRHADSLLGSIYIDQDIGCGVISSGFVSSYVRLDANELVASWLVRTART